LQRWRNARITRAQLSLGLADRTHGAHSQPASLTVDRLTTTPTRNKFGTKVLLLIMVHLYINNIHCKWHSIPPMRFSDTPYQSKYIVYNFGYLYKTMWKCNCHWYLTKNDTKQQLNKSEEWYRVIETNVVQGEINFTKTKKNNLSHWQQYVYSANTLLNNE